MQHEGETIPVGGVDLNVVVEGAGMPVFLIHGMGLDLRMWARQVDPLKAAGFQVIRYDARGHGRSGVPQRGYTLGHTQAEALRLLDVLEVERCHVVGLSMGGSISANLAVRHPRRFISATVVSSMASGYPGLSDFIRLGGTAEILESAPELESYRLGRLDSMLFNRTIDDPVVGEELRTILLDALQTTAILTEVAAERLQGWESPTDWNLWSASDRPVPGLVIAGMLDDETFVGFARESGSLPNTASHLVPGAQHMVNMSHADEVNKTLLEHLCSSSG